MSSPNPFSMEESKICRLGKGKAYLFDIDSGKAQLRSVTLDDSSLETEPNFRHGEGNSGI